MMTQENMELIQAGADGELDAAGQLELDQLLEVSTEARALFEELQRMNAFLATVPPQEPPSSLHSQILDGIQLPKASPLKRFFSLGDLPAFVRYGFAASAAVFLTVAVYNSGSELPEDADFSSMVGTMAKQGTLADGTLLDSHRYTVEGAEGEIRLLQQSEHLALEFKLASEAPVSFTVTLPDDGLQFEAFAQQSAPLDTFNFEDGRMSGQAQGDQRFVLLLKAPGGAKGVSAPIDIDFSQGGETLDAGELDPRR